MGLKVHTWPWKQQMTKTISQQGPLFSSVDHITRFSSADGVAQFSQKCQATFHYLEALKQISSHTDFKTKVQSKFLALETVDV